MSEIEVTVINRKTGEERKGIYRSSGHGPNLGRTALLLFERSKKNHLTGCVGMSATHYEADFYLDRFSNRMCVWGQGIEEPAGEYDRPFNRDWELLEKDAAAILASQSEEIAK